MTVCFLRRPHTVLPRSQVLSDTSSAIMLNFDFSFKHQTKVGLHADISEDRFLYIACYSRFFGLNYVSICVPLQRQYQPIVPVHGK